MKKIKTNDLKAGMTFDQPVFIDSDNVLVQANQEITTRDIERLKKWGIDEVSTNGSLKKKPAGDDTSQDSKAPATAGAPDPSIFSRPDDELKEVIKRYEALRHNKRTFRGILTESAEVLGENIKSLFEKKQFNNQQVIQTANRLTQEVCSKPLLLILYQATRYTPDWLLQHSLHSGAYAVFLAQSLGYSKPRLQELMFATILMDIGMFSLPLHIRDKQEALSEAEKTKVNAHPLMGYKLLMQIAKVKSSLATVALQHHETFDGKGYPQGLKAGQIEEISRIAQIADCYTAMIERRPYRKAHLPYDAMKTMLSVEMNRFDLKLLRKFLGLVSIYPIGSCVKLSNNMIGLVVASKPDKPLRPVLRLMRDGEGLPFNDLYFLDLVKKTDIYIVSAVTPASAGIQLENEI